MSEQKPDLYPEHWIFRKFSKFGKLPEPRSLLDKLFHPIKPSTIQLPFRVLFLKYILIIPIVFIENDIDVIFKIYSLSTVIDFTLITLLILTYNWEREGLSRVHKILNYSLLILSLFIIGQILFFSFFYPNEYIIVSIILQNGIEFMIFYTMKDRLVKSTDKGTEVYDLDNTTRSVMIEVFFVFMIVYLIPTIPDVDSWEFFSIFTMMLLGYIVFINLWIAGPNEFMDQESLLHLTKYTLSLAMLITLTGLFFVYQGRYELPFYFIFVANPILLLNLFSKYYGYVFRFEKHVQVATMIIDKEIIAK